MPTFISSLSRLACIALCLIFLPYSRGAALMISGNENKINLVSGTPEVVRNAAPDSLTILDFDRFPPSVQHLTNVPNSVIGPPSNIAISPNGALALIADSVRIDPDDPTQFIPESQIHVLDLTTTPPRIVGQIQVGRQPSGMSFTPDGRLALVANRADGTVSLLRVRGDQVSVLQTVEVCAPEESASDVAIHPNGRLALVSVQKGGFLQILEIEEDALEVTDRKISVYGQPYRCVITPDGALGLTAGQGTGNGLDSDALTVVDLQTRPIRTVDYVAIGAVPESIEVSPDGQLVAAVLMNGSNLAPDHTHYNPHGTVVLLERRGATYRKVQELPVGRIPEGVAFSTDGRHLVVQCHPDRELWLLKVSDGRLEEGELRIPVPGMPSSLRAAP
jgi:DNA-binding beta-propeller fold protein YncE